VAQKLHLPVTELLGIFRLMSEP